MQCQSDDKFDDNCNFLINEINTNSPKVLKNLEFIELKMECTNERKSNSLQGFKVIGISIEQVNGKQVMTIDLIANLWNEKLKASSDFFTIGGSNVPSVDLKTDSPYVLYRNKFTKNTQSLNSFFKKDNNNLHAIAIIYKKGYVFPEFVINLKKPFIIINSDIQELIKKNLVDFIVYGTKSPYDNCQLFTNLCTEYVNKEYILREFDNNKGNDRTLNRCSFDRNAFRPDKFKLGSATPGKENDCSGPHFFLEQFLSAIAMPVQQEILNSDNFDEINQSLEQINVPQCTASVDSSTYQSISDDKIEEVIQHETIAAAGSSCTTVNLGANAGNIAFELDRENRIKKRLNTDYEEDFEWQTTKHFQ